MVSISKYKLLFQFSLMNLCSTYMFILKIGNFILKSLKLYQIVTFKLKINKKYAKNINKCTL